jgi:sugar/nucleoside kinase (ribokinase family)
VVGVGENSVDLVYRLPAAPAEGGKVQASAHRVLCGGQVATTLAACASLGLRAAYVGTFGHDDGATRIREALTQRGIRVDVAGGR